MKLAVMPPLRSIDLGNIVYTELWAPIATSLSLGHQSNDRLSIKTMRSGGVELSSQSNLAIIHVGELGWLLSLDRNPPSAGLAQTSLWGFGLIPSPVACGKSAQMGAQRRGRFWVK